MQESSVFLRDRYSRKTDVNELLEQLSFRSFNATYCRLNFTHILYLKSS